MEAIFKCLYVLHKEKEMKIKRNIFQMPVCATEKKEIPLLPKREEEGGKLARSWKQEDGGGPVCLFAFCF